VSATVVSEWSHADDHTATTHGLLYEGNLVEWAERMDTVLEAHDITWEQPLQEALA